MHHKYTVSYSTIKRIFANFCVLFVFITSSPCTVNIDPQATPPKRLSSLSAPTLLVLESSSQSENVTCCPHVVCGCIKLQSKQIYIQNT